MSFTLKIDGGLPSPVAGADGLSWFRVGDLEFAWIGRPRFIRAGESAEFEELNHYLAGRWNSAGPSLFAEVRGSWAVLIHDAERKLVWAATDRFAAVPILYRERPDHRGLILSSDLTELERREFGPWEINRQAALQFLTLRHVADRQHLVAGVRRILPGTVLEVNYAKDRVQLTEDCYIPISSRTLADESELSQESAAIARIRLGLDEELEDGWDFHEKCSGRHVGLLYSGGVDSAFLAATLKEPRRDQLHLITYGFDGRTADLEYSRASLEEIGGLKDRWMPLEIRPEDTSVWLNRIIRETSLPVEHPNFLARRLAYQHLAELGVGTVIAGEGADTLLGGAWYVAMQKVLHARTLSERYRIPRLAWNLAARLNRSRRELFRLIAEPDWRMVCVLAKAYVPFDWLSQTARSLGEWSADSFPYHAGILDRVGPQSKLEAIYELGLMANMSSELAAEQAMARNCGMVQWNPYLDGLFPDRVASIPLSLRTKDWKAKYLLYKAARGTVPSVCLDRPKSGCPAPLAKWLIEPRALGWYVDAVAEPGSFCSELLGTRAVEDVVRRFRKQPNPRDAEILWVLVGLERWKELVLKNRAPQAKKEASHA